MSRPYHPALNEPLSRWSQYGGQWGIDDGGHPKLYVNGWDLHAAALAVAAAMGVTEPNFRTDWDPLVRWLNDGFVPEDEIVPAVRRVCTTTTAVIGTLRYFDRAVREQARRQPSPRRHAPIGAQQSLR